MLASVVLGSPMGSWWDNAKTTSSMLEILSLQVRSAPGEIAGGAS